MYTLHSQLSMTYTFRKSTRNNLYLRNSVVKQACGQVWKAVVQNTPRTLRELLPTLMTRLIAPQQQIGLLPHIPDRKSQGLM